ncbi:hypothetical protein LCGC14_2328460 [marine sediment metagenome]|uniref:DNA topoisomerase type IA zn finger domain-containing protein n=1 Tax=marine sediment metagenome TaxID=412755 RepID=A0A0F9CFK2_9ZZZZ
MVEREYPCPECDSGQLYDSNAGGMFGKIIKCDNPDCPYVNTDDLSGCVGADIDD